MMDTDTRILKNSLDRVLAWCESRDYYGYSKFDAFNSPVIDALVPAHPKARTVVSALWARSPVNIRPWLGTEISRNPKGIGLFATAYLRRYKAFGDPEDLDRARHLLAWLRDHACKGYSGLCWGYDHQWANMHFVAGKFTPNIVVTGNVVYAFFEAHEVTGDPEYLKVCESALAFMEKDLEVPYEDENMRSISYVPGSTWGVLNINGLAAALFIRMWRITRQPRLAREARRLTAFLVDKQTDYGAWHYAWPARTSTVKHDNYHTGNVLDWILDYTVCSGDTTFLEAFNKGLDFYRRNLFTRKGAPRWRSDRTYPVDSHGAAQGIITFSRAGQFLGGDHLDHAAKVARWAADHLQAPQGFFYYQKGRLLTRRYTLMRWCNAWMALALATHLEAKRP